MKTELPSYLGSTERERLRALPFPVLLPSQLPSGWSFRELTFQQDDEDPEDWSLTLAFSASDDREVLVCSATGGMGDPMGEGGEETLECPPFGPLVFTLDEDLEDEEQPHFWQSQWFAQSDDSDVFYGLTGRDTDLESLQAFLHQVELYSSAQS